MEGGLRAVESAIRIRYVAVEMYTTPEFEEYESLLMWPGGYMTHSKNPAWELIPQEQTRPGTKHFSSVTKMKPCAMKQYLSARAASDIHSAKE